MSARKAKSGSITAASAVVEDERRSHPRWDCHALAEIHIYPERIRAVGEVSDLSIDGCCIECDKEIPTGNFNRVEVHLHLNGITLQLAGVVRHMENKERAGIEFVDVSKRKAEQLIQMIHEAIEDSRQAPAQL